MYFKNDDEIFDYIEKKFCETYNLPQPPRVRHNDKPEPPKFDVCECCKNDELPSIVEDNELFTLYESPDKSCTIMRDTVADSNVYFLRGMSGIFAVPGSKPNTVDICAWKDDENKIGKPSFSFERFVRK